MPTQSPFAEIRAALSQARTQGQQAIDIDALLKFVAAVEVDAPLDAEIRKLNHDSQLAQYQAQHESNLAHYRATVENETAMFRSVIETAKTALSTSILINGGATVALLAFLGNIIAKGAQGTALQAPLVSSLAGYVFGVLLGAMATGSTYLSQFCYHQGHERSAVAFHAATVILVVASYGAFSVGSWGAYDAFT